MLNLEQLLIGANRHGASDLHLTPNKPPVLRINGDLKPINHPPVPPKDLNEAIHKIMPARSSAHIEEFKGADFSYKLKGVARFRCVTFMVDGNLGLTMRLIPVKIPSIEELNMPEAIRTIALMHRGLVLLTGVTGCGKSTTLASMIQEMNNNEARRVVTIEDPVEFQLESNKCVISQRQIGLDVPDFTMGLRQAMRMDPDVILVGEMRDVETIRTAIKAAETGHYVMSTLHTTSAVHTIQRILGHFDENEHDMLRDQLALNLKASVTQRLVKTKDGKGRRAAMEIMIVNATIAKLIHENRIADIFGAIRSRADGMQVMDQGLADLVREEAVDFEECRNYCDDFYAFRRYVQGVGASGDAGAILSA